MRVRLTMMLLILLPSVALAEDSLRCGSWVVTLPVSMAELLQKCGEPAARVTTSEDVRRAGRVGVGSHAIGTTTVEKWTYRPDPGSLPMVVTLDDGKVVRIERAE